MTVTPVVSADRRYVRLSVDAFFNDLNGFTTLSFPGGAVGGGNFGGLGGGIAAGMNGVIGDDGYESGVQVGAAGAARAAGGQTNMMRAGPLPGDAGPGAGDPMFLGAGNNRGQAFGMMPGFDPGEAALMFDMENGTRRGVRASARDRAKSPRRSARKPSTRRQSPSGSGSNSR
jgi:hypothetical protein